MMMMIRMMTIIIIIIIVMLLPSIPVMTSGISDDNNDSIKTNEHDELNPALFRPSTDPCMIVATIDCMSLPIYVSDNYNNNDKHNDGYHRNINENNTCQENLLCITIMMIESMMIVMIDLMLWRKALITMVDT